MTQHTLLLAEIACRLLLSLALGTACVIFDSDITSPRRPEMSNRSNLEQVSSELRESAHLRG